MIVFAPCKINIGLQILSRRSDGFHNISSIFYPLPLHDVLEIITAPSLSFHPSGIAIPGDPEDNLCLKAWHLLKKDFADLPPVEVYLYKNIPVGAGLGGGSSDAASMLKLLNIKYRLHITSEKLIEYAAKLGSDCAFFLQDYPCYVTGRGDELLALKQADLRSYHFLLVCPDIHVNTAEAYGKIKSFIPARSVLDLVREPVATWKDKVINDFEKPIFDLHPGLASIKKKMYEQGALFASMSGSGSSIFGIFEKEPEKKPFMAEGTRVFSF